MWKCNVVKNPLWLGRHGGFFVVVYWNIGFLGFYDFVVFNGEIELDEGADEDENQVPAGDEVDPLFCGLEPGGLFEEFAAEKDEEEEKDGYEEEGQSPFIGFVYFCPGGGEFLFFFFGHGFLFLILW